jgi:hypothetical protein
MAFQSCLMNLSNQTYGIKIQSVIFFSISRLLPAERKSEGVKTDGTSKKCSWNLVSCIWAGGNRI